MFISNEFILLWIMTPMVPIISILPVSKIKIDYNSKMLNNSY